MSLKVFKADKRYKRYFKEEILKDGAAYVVSSDDAVSGFFSFEIKEDQAAMNFPFCLDQKAIELAFNQFLEDYPTIKQVKCLSRQKLDRLGFVKQVYQKEEN